MPEQQAKTGTVSGKPTYIHHFPKKATSTCEVYNHLCGEASLS